MSSNEAAFERDEVTLLIDGDIIAFRAAAAAQQIYEDRFGILQPFARRVDGEAIVDNMMFSLELAFKASHIRVALTDPKENWRNEVYPAYKGNRSDGIRPLLLTVLKDYLREKYGAFHWPSLEADDVLGILNTEPQEYPGKRILVGSDKDFRTVPGLYHTIGKTTPKGRPLVEEITPWEATRFHMFQTLAGDAVDGYPGCKGMGKKRAEEWLASPTLLVPSHGVITVGKNKGQTTTRWKAEPTRDFWAGLVSHYCKAGEGEQEALVTARLAHILHHEDYDRETGEIRLWCPDKLRGL